MPTLDLATTIPTLADDPVGHTPTVEDVLRDALAIYESAPAHGLPTIMDRELDVRTHCPQSAICTAGFADGRAHLIGPACKRLASAAKTIVTGLPAWEAANSTSRVCNAFRRAILG